MGENFFERVYSAVRQIPCGRVASYGAIARKIGAPRAARQVGWALHVNPDNTLTPCHRVVTKDGKCSPAFKFGGENVQKELLINEGVKFLPDGSIDMRTCAID